MDGAGPERCRPTPDAGPPHTHLPAALSPAEEQCLRWQIRLEAAAARRAAALCRFGTPFDVVLANVCDELDRSFWTRDEWGSSFDREHFARTVVGLVEGPGCCLDPVLVTAVLDCLEYTLTNPVVYGPGNVAWPEKRCTTYHEDTVAADAVAAIFEAHSRTSR
ncbi:hypothetical protein [Cellulomonas composti]|nr:hypothetical protein [Cellulomonas composti]